MSSLPAARKLIGFIYLNNEANLKTSVTYTETLVVVVIVASIITGCKEIPSWPDFSLWTKLYVKSSGEHNMRLQLSHSAKSHTCVLQLKAFWCDFLFFLLPLMCFLAEPYRKDEKFG